MKTHQVVNGTSYDSRTPDEVIRVLESARLNRTRIHISFGETEGAEIGKDWLEEFDCHGYVGRSMGPTKVPLLISNRRSMGGGAILDHCTIRIRTSSGGGVLYRHPNYHHGNLEIRSKVEPVTLPDGRVLAVEVLRDGVVHATFETMTHARRWAQRLGVIARIVA